MIYYLDTEIKFGNKYPGKTIKYAIETDVDWVDWCLNNLPWFKLHKDAMILFYLESGRQPLKKGGKYE